MRSWRRPSPARGAVDHEPVPVAPIAQPLRNAADRGARRAGAVADVVVADALVKQPCHVPALAELLQLVDRAQVTQKLQRLVTGPQRDERIGQLGDLVVEPAVLWTGRLGSACRWRIGSWHDFITLKHYCADVQRRRPRGQPGPRAAGADRATR